VTTSSNGMPAVCLNHSLEAATACRSPITRTTTAPLTA
jgi:hypothetical protein